MKNGSIATEGATSNGLKGVVLMSNVYMLDPGANNEHNMAKELVDNTDNGHKNSIHLSNVVANEGHKIVRHLGNGDMMNHEHGKNILLLRKFQMVQKSIRVLLMCIRLMKPTWMFTLI